MSTHVFYPSEKTIRTKTTAYIKPDYLVALEDYQVWVCFSDGSWVLFDGIQSNSIKEGKFLWETSQLNDPIQSPRALNKKQVIYANCSNLRLEVLNVAEGYLDTTWTGETPSLEALPSQFRSDMSKLSEAFNDLKIEVLRNSQLIGVFERKEVNESSTDYILSVYEKGTKQKKAQVVHQSQQKQYSIGKGNDDNLFIFVPPYHEASFSFLLFDVKKPSEGLKAINISMNIKTTLVAWFPWVDQTISFYGNADSSGVNEQYVYDPNKENQLKVVPMKYYNDGIDSLLTDVVDVDIKGQRVILTEFAEDSNVVLFDFRTSQAFIKRQDEESLYSMSLDKKFVVEYDGVLAGDEDAQKTQNTKINMLRIVHKTVLTLFIMKYAKSRSGVTYLELYKDPYIAKHISEMFF